MKKLFCLAAFTLGLAGCGTAPTISLATVQGNIANLCPLVNADLTVLSTSSVVPADQQAIYAKVLKSNQAFCSATGTLTAASLADFNTQVLQVLIPALSASGAVLPPQAQGLLLAVQLAVPLVQQVIAQSKVGSEASSK